MTVQRVDRRYLDRTVALLADLRVDLLGVRSRRLHTVLVADGLRGAIECRIAQEAGRVMGIVLAAPSSYWWQLPAQHWGLAVEVIRARAPRRAHRRGDATSRAGTGTAPPADLVQAGTPPRTWRQPGEAWRIIFVGTRADARGTGVAAALYRSLMADRSLVARIALDNTPSLRLHHAMGWQLYRDDGVVLAVHLRAPDLSAVAPRPAAAHPGDGPRATGSYRRSYALRCAAW